MHQAEIIVALFAAVAALVVLANKLSLPYPIVLVVSGLALSFVPRLPEVRLNPEIVFYFFLPPLLYPAALFTSWRDFRRNLRPILLLAIGLVLVTMVTIAWVAHTILPGLPWAAAFALGAIVSPPDVVSAAAVLRRLPVPHHIKSILEGESLVNDTTAFVATHGSPWDYDRRVPILFWQPGIIGRTVEDPVETVDIMPTLAAMIGLELAPGSIDGHCLEGLPASACPSR